MSEALVTYRSVPTRIATSHSVHTGIARATPISVLELFHPDGSPRRSLVLGSGCPPDLLPNPKITAGELDLIVLAPTVQECRKDFWLRDAVQSLCQKLARDGIAYILAPPLWRTTIKQLLERCGLFTEQSMIHLANTVSSRYLVPLAPGPLSFILAQSLPFKHWTSALVAAGARLTFKEALCEKLFPSLGFVMRRLGARPIFHWLSKLHPNGGERAHVLIRRSWRGRNGPIVLYRFTSRHPFPCAIAKLALTHSGTANQLREANVLAGLGPNVRSSGARIPELLSVGRLGGSPVLVESAIKGQPLASLLRAHPSRATQVLESVTTWLERWNRQTAVLQPLNENLLERHILGPAAVLAPILNSLDGYGDWLRMRCARITRIPCPLVATHNDLTMWNILRDDQGPIGIIDWETGEPMGLPLVDFFYAAVDGVAATRNYNDRLKAFQACFIPGGTHEPVIRRLATNFKRAIPTAGGILEMAFHSCWLHHAANEYRSTGESRGEFIKIVQWLATNRSDIAPWIRE